MSNCFKIIKFNYLIIRINLCRCEEWQFNYFIVCIVIIIWKFCWILIVIVEFTMEMVIGNEELNLIILSQFYSIIACYVFLLFLLILIVIYVFL